MAVKRKIFDIIILRMKKSHKQPREVFFKYKCSVMLLFFTYGEKTVKIYVNFVKL